MMSTRNRASDLLLLACVGVWGCAEAEPPVEVETPAIAKRASKKTLRKPETARELRHRLIPRIVAGGKQPAWDVPLLRFDAELGLGVTSILRRTGHHRPPTEQERHAIASLGEPLGRTLRRNLGRMLREAELKAYLGADSTQAGCLYLETELPGVEACILLPELWDHVQKALKTEAWLALPDRGHCYFVPADPSPMVRRMAKELFAGWYAEGSDPLCDRMIVRHGNLLVAGPSFAQLARD